MSILSIREAPELRGLVHRIDAWVTDVLGTYVTELPTLNYSSPKTIHDSVWGGIFLHPWELCCLDSPLLQRLRYIRQLGVAHYLFPTSGYSRFEHTLGCVEQIERITLSLDQTASQRRSTLGNDHRFALRLAGLFHDVGHCAFSHVTEKFYRLNPEVAGAVDEISDFYGCSVTPSEVLSILIVSSEPTREMLRQSRHPIRIGASEAELVDLIAACIAGSKLRTKPSSFLAEIVNGPVDADKLDYLARDSHMAGTPIMLDPRRLLSKLRLAHQDSENTVIAIDPSGARAFEEMLATRVFLYDKLYFHHKMQAAEELIRQGLRLIEQEEPRGRDPAFLLGFTDDQLLELPLSFAPSQSVSVAANLMKKVKNRRLPKRAFSFAPRFLLPAPHLLARLRGAKELGDIRRGKVEATRFLRELEAEPVRLTLADKIQTLAKQLRQDGVGGDLESSVYVTWPRADSVIGSADVQTIDSDGRVASAELLFSASKWVDAYSTNKQTGYVFGQHPSAELYVAAERVFADHGIYGDSRSYITSKVKESQIDLVRQRVADVYSDDDTWIRHRLAPEWLHARETKQLIENAAVRLESAVGNMGVPAKIWLNAWLWQFPDADLQESALRLAQHFQVIGRDRRSALLSEFVRTHPEDAAWTFFSPVVGSRPKSSEMIGYLMKDLGPGHPEVRRLTDISVSELQSIGNLLFFDDCTCTGEQGVSLLLSWFDRGGEVVSERDRTDPLPREYQEVLRSISIDAFFFVGRQAAVERLQRLSVELGLRVTFHLGIDFEAAGYTLDACHFATSASKRRMETFLRGKGEQLLSRRSWEPQQVEGYALGFWGLAATFGFEYSVPTATVTALWDAELAPTSLWLPLVPRYPAKITRRLEEV